MEWLDWDWSVIIGVGIDRVKEKWSVVIGENDVGFRDVAGGWIGTCSDIVMGADLGDSKEVLSPKETDGH